MLYSVFYFNLLLKYGAKYFNFLFVNICEYPWISMDVKKICRYSHGYENRYWM